MAFIDAQNLSRSFVRYSAAKEGGLSRLWRRERTVVEALSGASFSVERGELVGLIGPNGAGKSTTVKLLTGILTPSGGTCTVDGRVPWQERREHVRHLGAVFGQRTQLWWDVPIRDSFELLRDIYSLEQSRWQQRLDMLANALDLGDLMGAPLRQLSLGQRMRAELCGSLLHEPALLFLDEPTIGLDAVSKLKLRAFLKEENARGTTILLTTHDMEDMLALCTRVMVLGHGKLLYDGQLDALLKRYDTVHTLRVAYEGAPNPESLAGLTFSRDGDAFVITYEPAETPTSAVLPQVLGAGRVREMTLKEQNVDELIARMYQEMAL